MATDRKTNVFNQISIAAQIIDGSIRIDSQTEFENVLRLFPNDPALLRAYADLLVIKKSSQAAIKSYEEAANLFIDSGMTLQAIVSKSMQWKLRQPSDTEEIRQFFTTAGQNGRHSAPVNAFFSNLSYSAIVSILYPLVKIRLPAGRMVKKVGDEETYLYFIVSGALRATTFQPVNTDNDIVYKKSNFHLSENDFFGDIYPFEEKRLSTSYVETISETELIKISKINLMKVCVKCPEVERGLAELFESQSGIEEKENGVKMRIGSRQPVPVKVHLQIQAGSNGNPPLTLKGYSRDISIGGICVVLDSEYRDHPSLKDGIKDADVQISLPSEDFTVNVPGKVIWSRQIDIEHESAIALGMQFREMSPKSRGMLLGFANNLKTN
jgi:PilZ domain/Cyclic nucleotide-binding domain